MNFPLDYDDEVERRRTHPKLLPNVEADTAGGILEMKLDMVSVEDNAKAAKLASSARSAQADTQATVDKGKSLSQRSENRLLGQRRSVLDGPAPRGSGVGTGYKYKYLAGVLYPPVAKYLASEPELAKQKRLSSGLIERLIAGLPFPGRYVGPCI